MIISWYIERIVRIEKLLKFHEVKIRTSLRNYFILYILGTGPA